jgi:hypothetical protein
MIHHFPQTAMLEADALIGQHAVGSALQLAAYRDIRRVGAVIIDAGISLGVYADAQFSLSRAGDKDAQVRGDQHIGILAHRVIGLDSAPIERHHEGAVCRVVDGAILRQVNTAGRA